MKSAPLEIPGLCGPLVVSKNEVTGRFSMSVAGQPAPMSGKREFALPTTSGETVPARVAKGSLLTPFPTIDVGGTVFETGPKVPAMLMVLALLPLVLVPLGGLIGGVTGACAVLANFAVVRTNVSRVAQILIMVGVLLAAAVVWIVVATAFQMAIG